MADPRIHPTVNSNDIFATVGVASAIVLAANPRRVDCDFTNTSENTIYLARNNIAVIGSGIPLNPLGGTYHMGTNNLFNGPIYAIATGANSNLAISEGYV